MLTRNTVEDIIECRLPTESIIEHLESLTSSRIEVSVIQTFVEVLREGLDEDARKLSEYGGTIDPSGTGGSGLPHFNTSTTVAFILAAGDLKVAKFGNRAAQSKSGSFDLLDAIGVPSALPPGAVPELLDKTGLAFLFAPQYYPGLAKLAPIRKSIGRRTIFNNIGPLLNPLRPSYRVMGVACEQSQQAIGEFLSLEPYNRRSLIVRSKSGLDELEPYHQNVVIDAMPHYVARAEINNLPQLRAFDPELHVRQNGVRSTDEISKARSDYLAHPYSFTVDENITLFNAIINNEAPVWLLDLVCLNAAAGFVANCCSSIEACYDHARDLIKSGKVAEKVQECRRAYAYYAS